jgi:hypothetical protein
MPSLLSSTLQECVKFINCIKSRPLNSRVITALCKELGSEHDIFCFLNELSLNLQGANITIFKVQEKVEATIKKLRLWTQRVEKGNFKSFCALTELQGKYVETNINDAISAAIKGHLLGLPSSLNE